VPRRLPDGAVYLPKASQRLLHIRTLEATPQDARPSRELIGTVVPDPSSFGQVQAPMDGRIELSERGISHVGQRVEAGEVLAYLSPSIPIADLGTMQQLRAEVAGKLKIADQKLARLERIASVVAQREIDDTRAELDALREQQRVLAQKDDELIPLKAPVAGVISVANVRAGQVVTTRETLFEIVDPHRLWIEAISGAEHAAPTIAGAYANDPDGHSIKLSYIGRAPALRQQTQPLQFKVEERHDGLVIGSAVKVFVQQGDPVKGIVLPDSAVVRGADGLARVWVKTGPQQFYPQPIRTAPLDGDNIIVRGGIEDKARVVVDGAELLNQVR
jgi:multidrug efflux pump subunit AcrA (membrane-fusion protein)